MSCHLERNAAQRSEVEESAVVVAVAFHAVGRGFIPGIQSNVKTRALDPEVLFQFLSVFLPRRFS